MDVQPGPTSVALYRIPATLLVALCLCAALRHWPRARTAPSAAPAHHGSPEHEQQAAAAYEESLQAGAPREGLRYVRGCRAAESLRTDGLACIDGVLTADVAAALRSHVDERLARALAEAPSEPPGEPLLGVVLCKHRRHDLKLDLRSPAVAAAVEQAIEAVGPAAAAVLGPSAELFELGAVVADEGAHRQPTHPDTPWSRTAAACTAFVALQDVSATMGPTHFLPRSHTAAAHEAYNFGQPRRERVLRGPGRALRAASGSAGGDEGDEDGGSSDDGSQHESEMTSLARASAVCAPRQRAGDCALFDSRLLHYGGAHTGGARRVLFYISLRGAGRGAAWRGCGFAQPGTILDALRGRHRLARCGTRLELCAPLGRRRSAFSAFLSET